MYVCYIQAESCLGKRTVELTLPLSQKFVQSASD